LIDLFVDLKDQVKSIDKSVSSKEPRHLTRVLRSIPTTRRKLTHPILRKLICGFFPNCKYNNVQEEIQGNYADAEKS